MSNEAVKCPHCGALCSTNPKAQNNIGSHIWEEHEEKVVIYIDKGGKKCKQEYRGSI